MNESQPIITPITPSSLSESPAPVGTPAKKDPFWKIISVFIVIVALLRIFVVDPFLVHGSSMQPTYNTNDYVIVDKLSYTLTHPARGDVIVFDAPTNDGRYFIKRIIGLPGERVLVDGAQVTIFNPTHPNGFTLDEPYIVFQSDRVADLTLGQDEFFVMGDNRNASSDSRIWGALKQDAIAGKAFLRLLPFDKIGIYPGSIDEFKNVQYPGI